MRTDPLDPVCHTPPVMYAPPPPPPPPDTFRKFLQMSGGTLALVISVAVLLCCVGPVLLCAFGGLLTAVSPTPTPTP